MQVASILNLENKCVSCNYACLYVTTIMYIHISELNNETKIGSSEIIYVAIQI